MTKLSTIRQRSVLWVTARPRGKREHLVVLVPDDRPREEAARMGLAGRLSDADGLEPW